MQTDTDFVQAEGLDRCVQANLFAFDLVTGFASNFDDVTRVDRAVKLASRAGRADQNKCLSIQTFTSCVRCVASVCIALFDRFTFCFETGAVLIVSNQSLAFWQQEVAGKPVLDADLIAEAVAVGHPDPVEHQLHGVGGPQAHLLLPLADAEPGGVGGHDEGGELVAGRALDLRAGHHHGHLRWLIQDQAASARHRGSWRGPGLCLRNRPQRARRLWR